MTQLILGPIIGGLSHESAYLWGRTSNPAVLHAWLGQQPDLSDAHLAATSPPLGEQTGCAGFAALTNLTPKSTYYYALTLNPTPPPTAAQPYPCFTTFPKDGESRSFSFAFGSCFLPNDPHAGLIFEQLDSLRQASTHDPNKALRFIVLLGDQIYADDHQHNQLGRVARSLDDYRAVYAHTWSQPAFHKLLQNLPAFMTLDDHEVDDDWAWTNYDRLQARIPIWDRICRRIQGRPETERQIKLKDIQAALQAYWEHQGMHARDYVDRLHFDEALGVYPLKHNDQTSLAYTFNYGAAAFFVMDTRTRRIKKSLRDRTMLGEGQWQALESWLRNVKDKYPVKFIVTSCALLFRMWSDLPRDRWTGFPKERHRLLQFLADESIEGVHLLTGDLHSAHAISAELRTPKGNGIPLWEFCSTPFNQSPNWLAKAAYLPLAGEPLRNQQLHFVCAENNFGVVRVEFRPQTKPKVSFTIHRLDGAPPVSLDTTI